MHDLKTIRKINQAEIDKHAAPESPRTPRTRREASLLREIKQLRALMEKQQDRHILAVSDKRELFRKNNELTARLSLLQDDFQAKSKEVNNLRIHVINDDSLLDARKRRIQELSSGNDKLQRRVIALAEEKETLIAQVKKLEEELGRG